MTDAHIDCPYAAFHPDGRVIWQTIGRLEKEASMKAVEFGIKDYYTARVSIIELV